VPAIADFGSALVRRSPARSAESSPALATNCELRRPARCRGLARRRSAPRAVPSLAPHGSAASLPTTRQARRVSSRQLCHKTTSSRGARRRRRRQADVPRLVPGNLSAPYAPGSRGGLGRRCSPSARAANQWYAVASIRVLMTCAAYRRSTAATTSRRCRPHLRPAKPIFHFTPHPQPCPSPR